MILAQKSYLCVKTLSYTTMFYKQIYYLYQIFIALPLVLVLTVLTALATIIGSALGGAHIWGYYPGKLWSIAICRILLIPVKVDRSKAVLNEENYIFVANHQGAFDIFLIYGFLEHNFKWLMKKALRKLPLIGKACCSAGHIYVDRTGHGLKETLEQCETTLNHGESMVVFPEGSRSANGLIGAFKRGAFLLADDLKLPIVPVTINGSYQVLPRQGGWIRRHELIMTIHEPIPYIEGIPATDRMRIAYEKVKSALPYDHYDDSEMYSTSLAMVNCSDTNEEINSSVN